MKKVFVIHRHGARFPSQGQSGNLLLPHDEGFWKSHGMHLTPRGMEQLRDLGAQLRDFYPPHLFSNVEVFSSSTTRTILSALSLLETMVPERPYHIEVGGEERIGEDWHTFKPDTIRVSVEKNKDDSLFHLGKLEEKSWRRDNMANSPIILEEYLTRKDVADLLDKLFTISKCENLDPCQNPVSRLAGIVKTVNILRYSLTNNSPIIPNKFGISLTDEEKELIIELGDVIYMHYFTPHSLNYSEQTGTKRCAMLLDEICRKMLTGEDGIYIYSAHDTTLLALASAFGIVVPCPDFGSYYIIEVYANGNLAVKINTRPRDKLLVDLLPVYWPVSEKFLHLHDTTTTRLFPTKEFVSRFSNEVYRQLPDRIARKDWRGLSPIFNYFSKKEDYSTWDAESIKDIAQRFGINRALLLNLKDFSLNYEDTI
jgi:hypothetical protein